MENSPTDRSMGMF